MNHSVGAVAVAMIVAMGACVAASAADPPRTAAASYEIALEKAQAELGKAQWRYLRAVRERTRAISRQASQRAMANELSDAIAATARAAESLSAATEAVKRAQRDCSNATMLASSR